MCSIKQPVTIQLILHIPFCMVEYRFLKTSLKVNLGYSYASL